jgi:peptidoglycan/xylan/chitin deacetylase (PgdA/CDA1 family)
MDRWTDCIYFFIPHKTESSSSVNIGNTFKNVLLTFDDIPYQGDSFSKILDHLHEFNQKAVFFVIVSQINESNYSLLLRAVKEGHYLGNRGIYDHYHCFRSYNTVKYEIEECQKAIKKIYYDAGCMYPKIHFFRPGGEIVNLTIQKICSELNMILLLGSLYIHDHFVRSTDLNLWYIEYYLEDNDILSLHDGLRLPVLVHKLLLWMSKNYVRTADYASIEFAFKPRETEIDDNLKKYIEKWAYDQHSN